MPKRNETLKFSTSFLGTVRASATTTIVDTSYPMTYNTRWSANANGSGTITEVNEGNDAYFIVSSDNVPDGTVLSVMLSSGPSANGITGDDIVNYQYKQNITIYNNFASLKVSIAADQVTENREEFYGMLLDSNGSNLSYAWLAINDTSKTPAPTYSVMWSATSTGNASISTINEGSVAWAIVTTTNVPNGTVLSLRPNSGISSDDFTDNVLDRTVTINNNIGRVSYPIKADMKAEGNETFSVNVYTQDDFYTIRASAWITVIDTSRETVITIPDEYHLKGVRLLPLFKKILGRDPYVDEPVRVIVPTHIELNGFPRVVGREFLRTEVVGGLYFPKYKDTIWPSIHGISLIGMPNSEIITIDVYGKIIGGCNEFIHSNIDSRYADWTFTPSGLPMDYYGKHSSGYNHALMAGRTMGNFTLLGADDVDPSYETDSYAIYSSMGFGLIIRNNGVVNGHGGTSKMPYGVEKEYDWVSGAYTFVDDFGVYGNGFTAIATVGYPASIRLNIIGNGSLLGGGGAGGAGGGLLNNAWTHSDLGLAPFSGAVGGGGAPYGGMGYTFYGSSGDPVCPTRWTRSISRTAGRRLGDTGSNGYYSKWSAGSATYSAGGAVVGNQTFGPNGKGYRWNYTPGAGGGMGQHGTRGQCTLYVEYRWNAGMYTYNEAERVSASVPGRAGYKTSAFDTNIIIDTSLT